MSEARRLLLLRHGQTAWNAERRVQGHFDVSLDATGIRQAEQVAPVLAAMRPEFVITSDLCRAAATATVVARAAGLEAVTDARLREFDMGDLTGVTMQEFEQANPDEYALLQSGDYAVVPGGESVQAVLSRFGAALDDALARLPAGRLGIVISHGAATKVSMLGWLGLPPAMAVTLVGLGNCHWALIEESAQESVGLPRRRLVAYNQHA